MKSEILKSEEKKEEINNENKEVKSEIIIEEKILTEAQIEKKSKDLQLDYFEVSAKSGENIEEGIKNMVKKLIKRCNDSSFDLESSTTDDDEDIESRNRKNCCIF